MFCSVITVNRNNASGLEKTIRSVLSQRRDLFEFIVIDGASTDNSIQKIDACRSELAYVVSEPDKGVYDAMNKGIAHASGDYIIFMNSGDEFAAPDVLERASRHAQQADVMVGGVVTTDSGKDIRSEFPDFDITVYNLMCRTLCHQATFVRTSVLHQVGGFDLQFKVVADWCVVFQALVQHHHTYARLPFVVARYDVTGLSSGTVGAAKIRKEKTRFLQSRHPYLYADYQRMHRVFRWSPSNIFRYLKWRLFN